MACQTHGKYCLQKYSFDKEVSVELVFDINAFMLDLERVDDDCALVKIKAIKTQSI